MSVLQRTMRLFVMAALAVSSHIGYSQDGGYHPFSEPLEFDPDWQFFAPVQLQDMQDLTARQRANTGFYVSYDRMNAGMSRSDTEAASNKIDFTWGNRYDFGWMKSNESGWSFSVSQINGPNSSNIVRQQRLNQFVTNAAGGNGVNGANSPTQNIVGALPFLPQDARNNGDGETFYELFDSVNVGNYASFEANKTWRMEPYRYGGILEPMIGMRYAKLGDIAHNDTYTTIGFVNNATPPAVIAIGETLTQDRVTTDNHMVLGQLGFRYTKFANKWTFSNDTKFFAGHVYQNQSTSVISTTSVYAAPVVIGAPPVTIGDVVGNNTILGGGTHPPFFSGRRNNESTYGFDIRMEASYKAFKHLDLRGGFALAYFGSGIWRGATSTESAGGLQNQLRQDQDIVIPAFTFGMALNR